MEKVVEALAKKAGDSTEAHHALNFSQAACNVANALRVLRDLPAERK